MKKIFCFVIALIMTAILVVPVCAAADKKDVAYVTVSNGTIVAAKIEVELKDTDSDGKITINDALALAHDAAYEGGAAAGFASEATEYGTSLTKLWGVAGAGYGYYVNDKSAMSLGDEVKAGDHVYAFVYTDTVAWSDTYSYFDQYTVTAKKGESVKLTLSKVGGYDENWKPVFVPLEGAEITVDGQKTGIKTDAKGVAEVKLDKSGTLVVSATASGVTLVPPVCVATVASNSAVTIIIICIAIAVVAAVAAVIIIKSKKK